MAKKVFIEEKDYKETLKKLLKNSINYKNEDGIEEKKIKNLKAVIEKIFELNKPLYEIFRDIKDDEKSLKYAADRFIFILFSDVFGEKPDEKEIIKELGNLIAYRNLIKFLIKAIFNNEKLDDFTKKFTGWVIRKENENKEINEIPVTYYFQSNYDVFSYLKNDMLFVRKNGVFYVKENSNHGHIERPLRTPIELCALISESHKIGIKEIKVAYKPLCFSIKKEENKEKLQLLEKLEDFFNHYYEIIGKIAEIKSVRSFEEKNKNYETKILQIKPKACIEKNIFYSRILFYDLEKKNINIETTEEQQIAKGVAELPFGNKVEDFMNELVSYTVRKNMFDFNFIDEMLKLASITYNRSNDYKESIKGIINKSVFSVMPSFYPSLFSKKEESFFYMHVFINAFDYLKKTMHIENYLLNPVYNFHILQETHKLMKQCYEKMENEEKEKLEEEVHYANEIVNGNLEKFLDKNPEYAYLYLGLNNHKEIKWEKLYSLIEMLGEKNGKNAYQYHMNALCIYSSRLEAEEDSYVNKEGFFKYLINLQKKYGSNLRKFLADNVLLANENSKGWLMKTRKEKFYLLTILLNTLKYENLYFMANPKDIAIFIINVYEISSEYFNELSEKEKEEIKKLFPYIESFLKGSFVDLLNEGEKYLPVYIILEKDHLIDWKKIDKIIESMNVSEREKGAYYAVLNDLYNIKEEMSPIKNE